MDDDKFERYQELRQIAQRETENAVFNWATAEGVDDLTIGQIKSLGSCVVALMNHHTRQVYDMMAHATSKNCDS